MSNAVICLTPELHTPCPEGYMAWHSWADRMSKAHRQRRCRSCGLFAIWYPIAHDCDWQPYWESWDECRICGQIRERVA